MKSKNIIAKIIVYLTGLLLIAVGINFSKMAGLGISPVSSIPRALEIIWNFSLGTTTIIVYCVLVLIQFMVLRKDFRPVSILGVPVAIVFGFLVDLVGIDPNAVGHLLAGFPKPEGYVMQLLYLVISIIVIGLGVYIYLKPNLVPMPAEGLALAISKKTGKTFGDCKTGVDVGLILVAFILQLVFLGGFGSFSNPETVIIREGTVIAAVCVGQVVKLFRKLFDRK